jgi:hypothetical protein
MSETTITPPYHGYKPYGLRCQTCGAPEFASIHQRPALQPEPDAGGEWQQHEYKASLVIANVRNGGEDYDIIACTRDAKLPAHTAARIVTDHNAIPKLVAALEGVAIMLNAELERYREEPWAQRVRAALTLVKGGE